MEKQRGKEFFEDLWSPGVFKAALDTPRKIVFKAELKSIYPAQSEQQAAVSPEPSLEIVQDDLFRHRNNFKEKVQTNGDE